MLVGEPFILGADGVEIAGNNPTTASGLTQNISQYLHLLCAERLRLPKRVEVDVDETKNYARWRCFGDDVHAEPVPLVLAREGHAGDASEHEPFPFLLRLLARGKACARHQSHGRKGYALKRCLVLGVGHQEASAHSRIAQDNGPDVRRDFLEEDNIRRFQTLEDVVKDEFDAGDGPRGERIDVPGYERKALRLGGAGVP